MKTKECDKRGGSIKKDKYEEASLVIRKEQLIRKERTWFQRTSVSSGIRHQRSAIPVPNSMQKLQTILVYYISRQFLHHECFLPLMVGQHGSSTWGLKTTLRQVDLPSCWILISSAYLQSGRCFAGTMCLSAVKKHRWDQRWAIGNTAMKSRNYIQLERPRNTCQHKTLSILSRSHIWAHVSFANRNSPSPSRLFLAVSAKMLLQPQMIARAVPFFACPWRVDLAEFVAQVQCSLKFFFIMDCEVRFRVAGSTPAFHLGSYIKLHDLCTCNNLSYSRLLTVKLWNDFGLFFMLRWLRRWTFWCSFLFWFQWHRLGSTWKIAG